MVSYFLCNKLRKKGENYSKEESDIIREEKLYKERQYLKNFEQSLEGNTRMFKIGRCCFDMVQHKPVLLV